MPCEQRQELGPRHRAAAERAQVRRARLTVDEGDAALQAAPYQRRERDFGGVGFAAEPLIDEKIEGYTR